MLEAASKQKHLGASLHLRNNIYFLVLSRTDFDLEMIHRCLELLSEVERSEGQKVLVTTGPGAKYFSTGFSLKAFSQSRMNTFLNIAEMQKLLIAFMTLNVPTFCVMSGNAQAGGLIMSLCHDYRILWATAKVALSEIDVNLSIGLGYAKIIHQTLGTQGFERTFLGNKLNATEAFDNGLVNGIYADEFELERHIYSFAKEFLRKSADRQGIKRMKLRLHAETISTLENTCLSPE